MSDTRAQLKSLLERMGVSAAHPQFGQQKAFPLLFSTTDIEAVRAALGCIPKSLPVLIGPKLCLCGCAGIWEYCYASALRTEMDG